MLCLPFLSNRQLGINPKRGLNASDYRLNLDSLLPKLVCWEKDSYPSCIEGLAVPPLACSFRKDGDLDLLAVANEEGHISVIDTEFGYGVCRSFVAHHNVIFDICWMPHKNCLITGAGDYLCRLFDMKTCARVSSYVGHMASVRSVDVCPRQNVIFASGSRDGKINVWDTREKSDSSGSKPFISIVSAHSRKNSINSKRNSIASTQAINGISAVAFQDEHRLVSGGCADGLVRVWDLRKTYVHNYNRLPMPRYQIKYCSVNKGWHGCTSLLFDSLYQKLYTCSTENKIHQLDCHSYSDAVVTYSGLKVNTYYVKLALSPDDQYLLSGSSNHKAYIWKTAKPGAPFLELNGHTSEVGAVAWSQNNPTKLVTSCDDNKVFVWRVKDSEESVDANTNDVIASAQLCSEESSEYESSNLSQTIDASAVAKRNNQSSMSLSLKTESASTSKSITNFFSPLPREQAQHVPSEMGSQNNSLSLPISTSPSKCETPATSTLLRSPCKVRNENDGLSSVETSPSPSKSSPQGKENSASKVIALNSEDKASHNGQIKRKLSQERRRCKYHPDGCGRTRGHTRCGKKITSYTVPDKHNIKNYFQVVPNE